MDNNSIQFNIQHLDSAYFNTECPGLNSNCNWNYLTMIVGNTSLRQYFEDFLIAYKIGPKTGYGTCKKVEELPSPPYYVILYECEDHVIDKKKHMKTWNRVM